MTPPSGPAARGAARGLPPPGRLPVAVAIGASTGGPQALKAVLPGLPADLPGYVFVVQHIHPRFTSMLARRLGEVSLLAVAEARDGEVPRRGTVYVAPGGGHLQVEAGGARRGPVMRVVDAPPRHGVRPCADALFASLAECFGPRTVAVILTGMGQDGLEGCRAVKARGGVVLAEAPETCTVFGMPRAPIAAGVVDRVVPIGDMAAAIAEAVERVGRPGEAPRRRIAQRLAALSRSMAR